LEGREERRKRGKGGKDRERKERERKDSKRAGAVTYFLEKTLIPHESAYSII
jgi:hypothetical protein